MSTNPHYPLLIPPNSCCKTFWGKRWSDQILRIFSNVPQLGVKSLWNTKEALHTTGSCRKVCHLLGNWAELGQWAEAHRLGIIPGLPWRWAGEDIKDSQKWWLISPSQLYTQSPSEFHNPPSPLPSFENPPVTEKAETTFSPQTESQDREDRHVSGVHLYYILAQTQGLLLTFKDKQVTNYDLAVMQTRYSLGDGSVKQGKWHAENKWRTKSGRKQPRNRNLSSLYVFHSTEKKKN